MNEIKPPRIVEKAPEGDEWIPSTCNLCYGTCSILVHKVDGVAVKIEGNPKSTVGKGRLCGKGISGLMTHYDPNRVRVPLRRTNPEKGIGIDPGWEEISWDEALDEVAGRLKKIREDDPRKLSIQRTTTVYTMGLPWAAFAPGFGTENVRWSCRVSVCEAPTAIRPLGTGRYTMGNMLAIDRIPDPNRRNCAARLRPSRLTLTILPRLSIFSVHLLPRSALTRPDNMRPRCIVVSGEPAFVVRSASNDATIVAIPSGAISWTRFRITPSRIAVPPDSLHSVLR